MSCGGLKLGDLVTGCVQIEFRPVSAALPLCLLPLICIVCLKLEVPASRPWALRRHCGAWRSGSAAEAVHFSAHSYKKPIGSKAVVDANQLVIKQYNIVSESLLGIHGVSGEWQVARVV